MKISKRSGLLQDYAGEKIKISVYNAATDINYQLTSSDLVHIEKTVFSKLSLLDRDFTHSSSYEIKQIVFETLLELKFNSVAKAFIGIK